MAISKDEVKYIANLARLGLSEQELEHFQAQLDGILEYIDKLKAVDVAFVEPTAHVLDLKNVYRPDIVKPSLDPQKAMNIAPSHSGKFYSVQR
jgi:aspartyl-tRNA(Asn)/glutamyl-tRNA(Gln) amidotransferase subunit C